MSPVSEHLGVSWVVRNAVERFRPELEYKIDGPDVSITTFLTAGISKVPLADQPWPNVKRPCEKLRCSDCSDCCSERVGVFSDDQTQNRREPRAERRRRWKLVE